MSEIEKMYENAGVNKETECNEPYDVCSGDWECDTCSYANNYYPPFTAEKQIELIKWLSNFWVHINKVNEQFNISTGGGYVSYYAEDLADAIALYINSKWNNLTEQERTEIAEILKG